MMLSFAGFAQNELLTKIAGGPCCIQSFRQGIVISRRRNRIYEDNRHNHGRNVQWDRRFRVRPSELVTKRVRMSYADGIIGNVSQMFAAGQSDCVESQIDFRQDMERKSGRIYPAGDQVMPNQEPQRDQLFRVLAIQLGLLDATRLEQLGKDSGQSKGDSFASLILERAGLSDHDQQGLRWLVERTLASQQVATNDRSMESTGATGLHTPGLPEESKFLSTIINPLPQHSIISSAMLPSKTAIAATATAGVMSSADRYVGKRFHAKGGIGQVWLTRDLNFGREVALKELLPERRDELSEKRFLIEAKVTGQLEHPGIVPVYDLHTEGGNGAFYTMRFIQGRTLRDEIREFHRKKGTGQSRSLGQASLLNSFIAICNTIEYAHSRGVIHRDLKGQNVAIGEFGEVIVLDWGLAKVMNEGEAEANANNVLQESSAESTQDGAIIGTPSFMSPEQAIGQNNRVGPRSDIYSLGVILYEILTGQTPFKSDDLRELLKQVVSTQPLPPTKIAATVPGPLEAVCLKALAKKPEDRYGSARELADEVRRFLADEPR